MQYRYHNQPGCGGCLFLAVLLILVTGGLPLLFEVLGAIFFTGLLLVSGLVLAFWGFSWFIRRRVAEYERSQTETHNRFVFLLVNILVHIAGIDGEVGRSELNAIYSFFRRHLFYNQSQMYWVKEMVREAVSARPGIDELLADFKSSFGYEPRLILLELIYQVIYSKPKVIAAELAAAERIVVYLEINNYQAQAIHAKYRGGGRAGEVGEDQYYRILGLAPGATFEEIKRAYRTLSMEYHPDKATHLGEEFRQVAEEKMKEINVAYQYLKKKFSA
jgi:DnaJ like chaperone protein